MRRLDMELTKEGQRLVLLAKAGEMTRHIAGPGTPVWNQWPIDRLEALYELAFLRMFISWESFLEGSFYRYMCRHESPRFGQATVLTGPFSKIEDAETAVLAGTPYIAWYRPSTVINRCQAHILNGRHQDVFTRNTAWLSDMAMIRHRIAHGQDDAKNKFDQTTISLAGRAYPASRPGRFLRDWNRGMLPPVRWFDLLVAQFSYLGSQVM